MITVLKKKRNVRYEFQTEIKMKELLLLQKTILNYNNIYLSIVTDYRRVN